MEKTLKSVVKEHFVLFLDNLNSQTSDEFKEAVANLDGVCWYGVPGATDIWQPVDAGYAELLKVKIRQEHYNWLDKWYGLDQTFSASDRRILITHWVGEAYKSSTDTKFDHYRRRLFQKTGCLLTADGTADGTDDDLVQPGGLQNYNVPPPTMIDPSDNLALSSQPEQSLQDDDIEEEDDNSLEEMEVDEGDGNRNIFDITSHAMSVDS